MNSESKKIFVCEDHTIVLDGLKLLFALSDQFDLIGHAANGSDLRSGLSKELPDILILDLNLPDSDGLTLTQEIRAKHKNLVIIILTMYSDEALIERSKKAGANAYLLKNVSNEELLEVLEKTTTSSFYVSKTLKYNLEMKTIFRDEFATKMKLTRREAEIISLLAKGKSSNEIAEVLFLSAHTVNTHRKNILKKLNLNSTVDLVRFAHENKFI